jgi:DNA-binding MarR family transcriptional regulator
MAEGLNLATPTVSISIRQLEKNGLLTRKPDPNDGRAVQLFLTQTGTEIYQQAQTFHQKKFEQLLKGLSITERDTLVSLLEQAIRAAEEKSQGDTI